MKHQNRLTSEQQQEQNIEQHSQQQAAPQEFGTVEEMLRHDSLHTPVPPTIARRLKDSTGPLPEPNSSWWRRLLGS